MSGIDFIEKLIRDVDRHNTAIIFLVGWNLIITVSLFGAVRRAKKK